MMSSLAAPRPRSAAQGASYTQHGKLKRRWRAGIWHNGKQHHLGYFATAEEARQAHNDAAVRLGLMLRQPDGRGSS